MNELYARSGGPLSQIESFPRSVYSVILHKIVMTIQYSNPPTSLGYLLISYNTIVPTLSSLLDKHAPVISKLSKRKTKPNP